MASAIQVLRHSMPMAAVALYLAGYNTDIHAHSRMQDPVFVTRAHTRTHAINTDILTRVCFWRAQRP
jgi:hypothetical protein